MIQLSDLDYTATICDSIRHRLHGIILHVIVIDVDATLNVPPDTT